jgi:peroxiredoxin Q/BCP
MTRPKAGEKAPLFKLPNQDGIMTDVADSLGQFVVIYFYPKALTPGCTTQACGLRDNWKALSDKGIKVFGISPDVPKLLNKFKQTEGLPFDLLSDSEHEVGKTYETWVEKSMYGRNYMGMARDTFIVAPDGNVLAVLHKVKPAEHVKAIFEAINTYSGSRI